MEEDGHESSSFFSSVRRRRRGRTTTVRPSAAVEDSSASSAGDDEIKAHQKEQRLNPDVRTLLKRLWKVAAPYWSSEDKVQARLRLLAVFALTLGTTGISVVFNFLGRDFYNALAKKDQEQFTKQLIFYLGAFAVGIPLMVLRDYARESLSLRWRSWMTSYYMERYLKNQTFYQIQSQSVIDNPDQRIVDDLNAFTEKALSLSLNFFNATVNMISFSKILFGIYPPLFIALIAYSLGGTAISVLLGKELVSLNFMQEQKEADFRYALVLVRENAESIAFYRGEENEMHLLLDRFKLAFENLSQLLNSTRNLELFTHGYRYLIKILPAAVVAPMYFSGKIEFGVINQSVSAFNHILRDFSLIVYRFKEISAFSAVIDRLGEFDDVLDSSQSSYNSDGSSKIDISYTDLKSTLASNGCVPLHGTHGKLLEIKNLTLQTPRSGNILMKDLSFEINDKDRLLVTGPSGIGKTSLVRALAGLWNTGEGTITYYVTNEKQHQISASPSIDSLGTQNLPEMGENLFRFRKNRSKDLFFLPQRPYMVLGTLRQQLLYPTWGNKSLSTSTISQNVEDDILEKPSAEDLMQVLEAVQLGDIISRFNGLDSTYEWSSVLSLGEQQRLAFARLLLSKPKLVLLDESTSALDEANEAHLYSQIEAAGITYISIGHRKTLHKYHNKLLHISKFSSESVGQQNWNLEPIN